MPGIRVTVKTRTSELEPSSSRSRSRAPPGAVGRASGFATPRTSRSVIATRSILSARSSSRNCDIDSSTVRGARSQDWRNDSTTIVTSRYASVNWKRWDSCGFIEGLKG